MKLSFRIIGVLSMFNKILERFGYYHKDTIKRKQDVYNDNLQDILFTIKNTSLSHDKLELVLSRLVNEGILNKKLEDTIWSISFEDFILKESNKK